MYRLEMRLLIFKLVLELKEVIETFSTPEFLTKSFSNGSDEKAVEGQINAHETVLLAQSICNLREKKIKFRAKCL